MDDAGCSMAKSSGWSAFAAPALAEQLGSAIAELNAMASSLRQGGSKPSLNKLGHPTWVQH